MLDASARFTACGAPYSAGDCVAADGRGDHQAQHGRQRMSLLELRCAAIRFLTSGMLPPAEPDRTRGAWPGGPGLIQYARAAAIEMRTLYLPILSSCREDRSLHNNTHGRPTAVHLVMDRPNGWTTGESAHYHGGRDSRSGPNGLRQHNLTHTSAFWNLAWWDNKGRDGQESAEHWASIITSASSLNGAPFARRCLTAARGGARAAPEITDDGAFSRATLHTR